MLINTVVALQVLMQVYTKEGFFVSFFLKENLLEVIQRPEWEE